MAETAIKDFWIIPSKAKEIKKLSSKIIATLVPYNLDKEIVFDIRLSTEEALRNAMHHGNKNREDLPVEVSFSVAKGVLEITVEDKGEGFDYKNLPNPTTDKNILRTCGRGVFLIHKMMDEVYYNDKGNKVRMVKHLRRKQ